MIDTTSLSTLVNLAVFVASLTWTGAPERALQIMTHANSAVMFIMSLFCSVVMGLSRDMVHDSNPTFIHSIQWMIGHLIADVALIMTYPGVLGKVSDIITRLQMLTVFGATLRAHMFMPYMTLFIEDAFHLVAFSSSRAGDKTGEHLLHVVVAKVIMDVAVYTVALRGAYHAYKWKAFAAALLTVAALTLNIRNTLTLFKQATLEAGWSSHRPSLPARVFQLWG